MISATTKLERLSIQSEWYGTEKESKVVNVTNLSAMFIPFQICCCFCRRYGVSGLWEGCQRPMQRLHPILVLCQWIQSACAIVEVRSTSLAFNKTRMFRARCVERWMAGQFTIKKKKQLMSGCDHFHIEKWTAVECFAVGTETLKLSDYLFSFTKLWSLFPRRAILFPIKIFKGGL